MWTTLAVTAVVAVAALGLVALLRRELAVYASVVAPHDPNPWPKAPRVADPQLVDAERVQL